MYFDWNGRPHAAVPWPILIFIWIVQALVWALAWTIRLLIYLCTGVRRLYRWWCARRRARTDRQ